MGFCAKQDFCEKLEEQCSKKEKKKYYHEVGAEMIGNQLIIRMEKDKDKKRKGRNYAPRCDCDVVEIKRPSKDEGPRIVNGGDNNQIVFRIHSKAHLYKKDDKDYMPQAIAYKINKAGTGANDRCRKITIHPQLGGPISQEVRTDHVTDRKHDVYLLRVDKKDDEPDRGGKRFVEVELRTPKPPPKPCPPKPQPCPPESEVVTQQVVEDEKKIVTKENTAKRKQVKTKESIEEKKNDNKKKKNNSNNEKGGGECKIMRKKKK